MGKEIERKFLVRNSWKKQTNIIDITKIKQGYLQLTPIQVRIRLTPYEGFITIKGPKLNITCDEFEYLIPVNEAKQLLKYSITPIISKTRYRISDNIDQFWEIDVFHDHLKGLIVAEIELPSEFHYVAIPSWIDKEVSLDNRYSNVSLSTTLNLPN